MSSGTADEIAADSINGRARRRCSSVAVNVRACRRRDAPSAEVVGSEEDAVAAEPGIDLPRLQEAAQESPATMSTSDASATWTPISVLRRRLRLALAGSGANRALRIEAGQRHGRGEPDEHAAGEAEEEANARPCASRRVSNRRGKPESGITRSALVPHAANGGAQRRGAERHDHVLGEQETGDPPAAPRQAPGARPSPAAACSRARAPDWRRCRRWPAAGAAASPAAPRSRRSAAAADRAASPRTAALRR